YPDVFRMLDVSFTDFQETNAAGAQRFIELAIFPRDKAIPEAAAVTFWTRGNALSEETRADSSPNWAPGHWSTWKETRPNGACRFMTCSATTSASWRATRQSCTQAC